MLYLEDFLELMENLPGELRDRFTEIRELDLQVQNGLDRVEDHVRTFFRGALTMPQEERQLHFSKIKEEYQKTLEDSDEKVNLATAMHDLIRRYLVKLDVEIAKFKMELEADNPGITEVIEQRARAPEIQTKIHKKERKRRREVETPSVAPPSNGEWPTNIVTLKQVSHANGFLSPVHQPPGELVPTVAARNAYIPKKSQNYPQRLVYTRAPMAIPHPTPVQQPLPPVPVQPVHQPQLPPPSAHQQLAGLVAGREKTQPSVGYGFLPSFADQVESRHGRPRKLTPRVQEMLKEASQRHERVAHDHTPTSSLPDYQSSQLTTEDDEEAEEEEEDADESGGEGADLSDQNDQQRWCICNQVSYGEMVACDNKDCPFEWFHYQCVGITAPPKGKWFCPHCTAVIKRRNSKNLAMMQQP